MPNIIEIGYLEDDYLENDYGGGSVLHGIRSQIDRRIDTSHTIFEQIDRAVGADAHHVKSQIKGRIDTEHRIEGQIDRRVDADHTVKEQTQRRVDTIHRAKEQIARRIDTSHRAKSQISRKIADTHTVHEQINIRTGGSHSIKSEIRRGSVLFLTCTDEGYLEEGYLEGSYVVPKFCAHIREQVSRFLNKQKKVHSQINRRIDVKHHVKEQIKRRVDTSHTVEEQIKRRVDTSHTVREQVKRRIDVRHRIKEQIKRRIDTEKQIKEQINRMRRHSILSQITQVLYNTVNLRILCDFDSRGVSGINWTTNSQMAGDFDINNLNTDIVEQVWRSDTGDLTGLSIGFDSEISQGIFVDTLAILNHNMTTSASITWQASNDPGFATIGFSEVVPSARTNIYWIAPTLPTTAYRYHRFLIEDTTNPAGYIQWGTVLAGTSAIFQGEGFVDQVVRETTHFADRIPTEAFSNVSNDRALKFAVSLEFRNLQFNKGNYNKLREIFENDRTSLKCLWIPTPKYPSRYAVFGKLASLPAERHQDFGADHDYIGMEIKVDEAL